MSQPSAQRYEFHESPLLPPYLHYHPIIALPAESHEERVVGLGAVLDPSQKSHGRVLLQTLDELQHVQVLHRDPPEYRPEIDGS